MVVLLFQFKTKVDGIEWFQAYKEPAHEFLVLIAHAVS